MSDRLRWSRKTWLALALYAAALCGVGFAAAWHAPLGWDEKRFYLPAIQTMAAQLPHVTVAYALPQPPLMLIVQAVAWRLTASVAILRALATFAFIAAVFAAARIIVTRDARTWLLVMMIGTFPAMLVNAFSLKQHTFTLAFLMAALLAWRRRRAGWSAVFLALAILTHQLALAFGLTLGILALLRLWRERSRQALIEALLLASSVIPFAALVIVWHGVQPRLFAATFPDIPQPHFSPPQLIFALIMAGCWLEPLVAEWKRIIPVALLTPVCAVLVCWSGIARPFGEKFMEGAAGPVFSIIHAISPLYTTAVVIAGALVAAGVFFFLDGASFEARLYVASSIATLLNVPFYFESYYALVICMAWPLMADVIVRRQSQVIIPLQCGYIFFGLAYAAVKLL